MFVICCLMSGVEELRAEIGEFGENFLKGVENRKENFVDMRKYRGRK